MGGEQDNDGELEIYRVPINMIPKVWPHVLPMVERALEKGEGDWLPDALLNELMINSALMHIAIQNDITGFAISYMEYRTAYPIFHVWILNESDNLKKHLEKYEDIARNLGAKAITFDTLRKGFERNNMGYRRSYVTYRKDL